jgi:AcrR family transcriptional regulator
MDSTSPTVPTEKTRKQRRTKEDLSNAINTAAEKLIREHGFSNTLVTDIMKEANIEPTVFYKRYRNINEFYSEFVKKCDYWFSDILKDAMKGEDMMEDVYNMLSCLLTDLSDKSIMLELLRWEVAEGNEITHYTSQLREEHTLPLAGKYLSHYYGTDVDIVAWSSLLISGIYYLCLHKDRAPFCGIDINNPKHIERLKAALHTIVDQLRWLMEKKSEKEKIADKLRAHGVNEDIITKCVF